MQRRAFTICFAILFCFWLGDCLAQTASDKQDVLGFTPGMTKAAGERLMSEMQLKCKLADEPPHANYYLYNCDVSAGFLQLRYGGYLENNALVRVSLNLHTAETLANVVSSLSAQFGKRVTKLSKESDLFDLYRWNIGNGKVLDLASENKLLELYDPNIQQANWDAKKKVGQLAKPMPRL